MSRNTTYTPDLGARIVAARRIGATLRESAASAHAPWGSVWEWVKRGRRWNRGNRSVPGDAAFADFAADMDAAPGVFMTTLKAQRAKGVSTDSRLAHDIIKHEETKLLRNEELRLMKARARVEEARAAGTHVERHEITTIDDAALLEEARALAAALRGDGTGAPH